MSFGQQKYKIRWLERWGVGAKSKRHGSAGCDRLALPALAAQQTQMMVCSEAICTESYPWHVLN
jgi:hypothetical protein